MLMESAQEDIINNILRWDFLDAEYRGKMLRTLVEKGELRDLTVGSYFAVARQKENEAKKIIIDRMVLSFYGVDDEDYKFLNDRPAHHSPSDWSQQELQYYKIEVETCVKIEEMLVLQKMDQETTEFAEKHKDLSHSDMSFTKAVKESKDDFTRMLYYVYRENKIESHVDNLMVFFLRKILPQDKFFVFPHYPFEFSVGGDQRRSIPDVAVLFIPKPLVGMIIVEDKVNGADFKPENVEAQAIAEAIAVCQQKAWNEDNPIYFLRAIGYQLSFYKAIFSKDFLRDVELGRKRKTQTKMRKLIHDVGPGGDLFSLLDPKQRGLICQIIYSIAYEITTTFV